MELAALAEAAVELPWLSEEDAGLAEDPCWAEEDPMEEDAIPEDAVAEVDPPMPDVAAEDVPDAREEGPPAEPAADDDPDDEEEDDDRPTRPEEPPETAPEVELPVEASDSEVPLLWVHAVDHTQRDAETTSQGRMRMGPSKVGREHLAGPWATSTRCVQRKMSSMGCSTRVGWSGPSGGGSIQRPCVVTRSRTGPWSIPRGGLDRLCLGHG